VGASPTIRRVFERIRLGQLLLGEKRLTWREVTPIGGSWRQWTTEEKSEEGLPAAEILEVGPWAGFDSGDAYYVLETDERDQPLRFDRGRHDRSGRPRVGPHSRPTAGTQPKTISSLMCPLSR